MLEHFTVNLCMISISCATSIEAVEANIQSRKIVLIKSALIKSRSGSEWILDLLSNRNTVCSLLYRLTVLHLEDAALPKYKHQNGER